ncbi:uncharacterized protein LOC116291745 [Actinia tenebrosa]|uniref:Uncharacterized protein LOC116291745 n=1 Tax=Actinia tenebrosa TaxID=6105 RepID=A0A6P8HG55_ACTTE|nr:uncharacterized protein LOC116291745 [Actinia tenebrosa]
MLSLQIKKDEVKFGSSSPKMKARRVMSLPGGETDTIDECTESDLTDKYDFTLEKKEIVSKQQFLPLIRSQSAKSRRTPSLIHHSSPPPSPRAFHILRTNSLSSSTSSLRETDKDRPSSGAKDCQQRISPRYSLNKLGRSSTASPVLTAKFPKNHSPPIAIERRVTTGASPPTSGPNSPTITHRGLAIKPPSRNTNIQSTTKNKQEKTKVFSRLYQVQPKTKKTVEELLEAHDKPTTPKLDRRRRSLSMPDLTDMMDGLRNCRYLRTNSTEDD